MATTLFNDVVFGPLESRRLGTSLGINLLPSRSKLCNFDCVYCECGWTASCQNARQELPDPDKVKTLLEQKMIRMRSKKQEMTTITFAGNGEPTLHPRFGEVMDATVSLRNSYFPETKIAVLSNGTQLRKPKVVRAIKKADQCIIKLDAGSQMLFQQINRPVSNVMLTDLIRRFSELDGQLIIQSLFFKGFHGERDISNLYNSCVEDWLEMLLQIHPYQVMLYTLDRDTPVRGLIKASFRELFDIATKVEEHGISTSVYTYTNA